jgi:hypothetical protein
VKAVSPQAFRDGVLRMMTLLPPPSSPSLALVSLARHANSRTTNTKRIKPSLAIAPTPRSTPSGDTLSLVLKAGQLGEVLPSVTPVVSRCLRILKDKTFIIL